MSPSVLVVYPMHQTSSVPGLLLSGAQKAPVIVYVDFFPIHNFLVYLTQSYKSHSVFLQY